MKQRKCFTFSRFKELHSSKAQLTVFIIIGILVLVAFGLTLYIGRSLKPAEKAAEPTGIQPIQDYITTCLELATNEGLMLIGRQGGAIYESQGGITPSTQSVKYTDNDLGMLEIPYLILPPAGNVEQLFYAEPPEYPFPGFPYAGGETLFLGYYGVSKLPPLYKTTPEGEKVTGSIQENLETFIAKKAPECASWKKFEDKGYKITAGNAIVSLLFANQSEQLAGEQNINVQMLWPVEITTPDGDKALRTDFATRQQVRLATIYFTVKKIIDSDSTDISFVPRDVGVISVKSISHGDDSVITITDSQSIASSKPYQFTIPRKNRKPALWQIKTEPLEKIVFHVTPEGRGAGISTTANSLRIEDPCQDPDVQNPYVIELKASDPDENTVTFSVSDDKIPANAPAYGEYTITISAKDQSTQTGNWDFQKITLKVALCEVR